MDVTWISRILRVFRVPPNRWKNRTITQLSAKHEHIGIISGLMAGASITMFSVDVSGSEPLDRTAHGILWCMATYAFMGAAVISEAFTFSYNRCADDFEARRFAQGIGSFTALLPISLAGIGFILSVLGTSHYFVMQYRMGLEHRSFTACASFCYTVPCFVLVGVLKVNYSLNTTAQFTEHLEGLKGLKEKDLELLLEHFWEHECKFKILEADLEAFVQYASTHRVIENDTQRGGPLTGMRLQFAEMLFKEFYEEETGKLEAHAKAWAKRTKKNTPLALKQKSESPSRTLDLPGKVVTGAEAE
jgi:hypothetical protein